jgi:uncharacterized protein YndB with AHSA1/START domain
VQIKKNNSVFVISEIFKSPLSNVYKAWSDPKELEKWWGPKGVKSTSVKMDLRDGGLHHYKMLTEDGKEMWGMMEFIKIDPMKSWECITHFSDADGGATTHPLNPHWPKLMHTRITFTERNNETLIRVEWVPLKPTELELKTFMDGHESMKQGWGETFQRLKSHL